MFWFSPHIFLLLLNFYYSQSLYKVYTLLSLVIRFMRVDTLSLLLSMANIGAYSDVLVVDMVGGLVVGAVAERLGGKIYFYFTLLLVQ